MAKIPPEKIAEIRDAIRLEDWVGRTVSLKKQGRRWVGLCPFHAEKSPSFGVSEDKQLYHCFGCGVGGDLFDYVQRLEGLDFIGSLRMLAHAAGIELPKDRPTSPKEREADEKKDRMFAANAVALEVFRGALEQDPAARRYLLEERGLSEATLERFELGWAPADWSYLSDRLGRAKVGLDDAVELGLLGRRATNNRPYDRLRGRVTFPIRLPSARIAGFGARRADWVDPEGPKYLNSPESLIYDKSKVLYGLGLARDDIRKKKQALLVEGYLDVILLAQAGLTHTVAGCGTALTESHARSLSRLTREVVTLYDGDRAGLGATHRTARLLLAAGLEVRTVALPEGMDPDDLVRREGAEAFRERVETAPSVIDFFLAREGNAARGGGIAGTRRAVETLRPLLEAIADPLARDVAFDACARALGIDRRTLSKHFPRNGPTKRPPVSHSTPNRSLPPRRESAPRPHVVETELLKILLEAPELALTELESKQAFDAFSSEPVREVALRVRSGERLGGPEAIDTLREHGLTDARLLAEVRAHLVRTEEPERHDVEILVGRLLEADRKRRMKDLRERLARATTDEEHRALLVEAQRIQSGSHGGGSGERN